MNPKTIKGRLLLAYLSLVAIFLGSGIFVLSQLTHLRQTSRDFFDEYAAVEDLIISSRFLIDEIGRSVLAPPENLDRDALAALFGKKIRQTREQFDASALPRELRLEIGDAIDRFAESFVLPLQLHRVPIGMMEEADDLADACLAQAERLGRADVVSAIAGIVDAYTDTLLTNDPKEKSKFDARVRSVEESGVVISSFPQLKQKASAIFETNARLITARNDFREAGRALSRHLADVENTYQEDVLLPTQLHLTEHVRQVGWLVFFALLFTLAVATISSLLLAKRIWSPLSEMRDMVTRMSHGDLNIRLGVKGDDEFSMIARSMNRFADQLKQTLEQLDTQMADMAVVEADLRKSEAYNRELSTEYQAVLDGISESLVVINRQRNVVWSNKQASEEFFSEVDRKVEKGEYELDEQSPLYMGSDQVEICFDTGQKAEELIFAGGRHFRVRAFPLKNSDLETVRVLKMVSDVSEQFLLKEEAERSNRLASLGELSAGIAHEINNPNSLILLNAPIARDAIDEMLPFLEERFEKHGDFTWGGLPFSRMRTELPAMMTEMRDAAQRIQRIVDDLKNFVRQDNLPQLTRIDLNICVEAGVRLTRNAIRKATDRFSLQLDRHLPLIQGNTVQLEQVVVNLVHNACLALPERNRGLTVRTEMGEDSDSVLLVVRDEGVGVPANVLSRLTDPFFTTRRKTGGTGLGLSISNRIVREHGGKIIINSKEGEWTEVVVHFPVAKTGGLKA